MNSVSISLPASLIFEQARCLMDNLSENTALSILQQHDVRFNKNPRKTMTPDHTVNHKAPGMMGRAFTSMVGTVQVHRIIHIVYTFLLTSSTEKYESV